MSSLIRRARIARRNYARIRSIDAPQTRTATDSYILHKAQFIELIHLSSHWCFLGRRPWWRGEWPAANHVAFEHCCGANVCMVSKYLVSRPFKCYFFSRKSICVFVLWTFAKQVIRSDCWLLRFAKCNKNMLLYFIVLFVDHCAGAVRKCLRPWSLRTRIVLRHSTISSHSRTSYSKTNSNKLVLKKKYLSY